MTELVQVTTATDTREAAVALARSVIEARLAAGAQVIGPVVSVFWHKGEYGEGEEWQAVFKTTADRYAELEKHLVDNHPWQRCGPLAGGGGAAPRVSRLDHLVAGAGH